jgi:hypothetical protein
MATALGACSSDDAITIDQAASQGSKQLDALQGTLTAGATASVAWQSSSGTTPSAECAKDEARWVGVGTVTIEARTDDGDGAVTLVAGNLGRGGWQTGLPIGDLDDDQAATVPAVLDGDNPAGLTLTVTVERAAQAWHHVVTVSSACAAKD